MNRVGSSSEAAPALNRAAEAERHAIDQLIAATASGDRHSSSGRSAAALLARGGDHGHREPRRRTLRQHHHVRDGTPVSTPVWVAGGDGALLVHSEADSWKVRRIRRDCHVRVAPCNARGVVRGDPVDADAALDEDTTQVSALLARKYGLMFRAVGVFTRTLRALRRRPEPASVTIRIVPRSNGGTG